MADFVIGDKELIESLKKLEPKQSKAIIRKGSREAAKAILPTVKDNAPISEKGSKGSKPGTLKKSYKVRSIPRNKDGALGARIQSSAPHAHLIEKGFKHWRNGKQIEGQWPQYRAAKDHEQSASQLLESTMDQLIREAMQ